jgi:hypothetical protein
MKLRQEAPNSSNSLRGSYGPIKQVLGNNHRMLFTSRKLENDNETSEKPNGMKLLIDAIKNNAIFVQAAIMFIVFTIFILFAMRWCSRPRS